MPDDRIDPRETFSGSARRYLSSTDHAAGADLEMVRRVACQLFPAVTVDVATGAGHAIRAASPFSGFSVALDLTMEMLRLAREHLTGVGLERVRFLQSAADHLPLADRAVSLLVCRIAPHHFRSLPGFLREAGRILHPEGRGVIIDSVVPEEAEYDSFMNEVERLRDPSHVRSYTLKQWFGFFRAAGFEVVSAELFERTHPFREWAARTGLDEVGIRTLENRFKTAPPAAREKFRVQLDKEGRVTSYTDEKGIFVVKKGKGKIENRRWKMENGGIGDKG